MNLRDLRYLVALADHKHFGRAASASFVSQPTLSTQIRKLEEELGVSLVERAPRRVMLTPIGREIAERARRVIAEVAQMGELARRSQDPEAGTVRLGLFPTLAPYLLPHVLPGIRARFPRLELLLVEEKTDALLARLHEGRLDAAILALPLHDDQLHVEPLFTEPFLLAVPRSHDFARRSQPLALHDLDHERLLLLEEGHCLRDQALDVCRLAGAEERDFRATSLETLRQMVAAGIGMTLLPMLSVQPPVPPSADIQLLSFAGKPPSREIAMAWRRSSAMGGFLQQLAGEFKALPPELLRSAPATATPQARRVSRGAAT
ncbi:LysR substrate-binding domain-containing protein [Cognatiluteimonas profundi]|uniref:LysR substrate-binding domain-containing protein n=1 Tax=Cognatiluteimonas profundi TaxID=2594501 RepID=UPI00131DC1DF|nr:LysR substrate-binding domain-containing protein [Lysobacter profundi]